MSYRERVKKILKFLIPQKLRIHLVSNRVVRYLTGKSDPHVYLVKLVKRRKCKRFMEIGVSAGEGALGMISAALENVPPEEIEYYGFDIFGKAPVRDESRGYPLRSVRSRLEKTGARINLFKGDTLETLPRVVDKLPPMDFIYIDGGHSFKTVNNDWRYAQKLMTERTLVVFDDYDLPGPRAVVDEIDRKQFEVKAAAHFPIRNKVVVVKKKDRKEVTKQAKALEESTLKCQVSSHEAVPTSNGGTRS